MIFQYSFPLAVTVEQAWLILLDVYRVVPCMPGAAIESGADRDYIGRIKVRLGPVEMTYRGNLHFTHRDDVNHELIVDGVAKDAKGSGGAKATVKMRATAMPAGGCQIDIASDYSVSGRAAQFGRGIMEEVGEKLMTEFANRLNQLIEEEGFDARDEVVVTPASKANDFVSNLAAASAPINQPTHESEVLNLGSVAGWAIASRALIALAAVTAFILAYWVLA